MGVPILLVVLMYVFNINYALRLSLSVLIVSLIALLYAFKVFIWIMSKDKGPREMIEVADCITEGSEGYF